MAEGLKTFIEGEDILASETNANNQFLLGRISENAERLQDLVDGQITSIQSNIGSVQATLQNSINEMSDKLGSIYENIAPNFSAGISVSSGWTAPSSGWITVSGYSNGSGSSPTISIDGIKVWENYQDSGDGRAGYLRLVNMFFIGKGQEMTTSGRSTTKVFYPCKGVKNA